MNKQVVSRVIKEMTRSIKKHSPEILTGIGIAGMIATTVTAVSATPKALRCIEEKKKSLDEDRKLKPVEVVKATWKCYIPAAISGSLSVACLIGASSVNLRRNAALTAAYTLSETALKEYQEKAVEVVGEKKEQEIRQAVAQEQIVKHPVLKESDIIDTGFGDTLFLDPLSGRRFWSDINAIRKAENRLNKRMRDEVNLSLNEFYTELGLPEVDSSVGDSLGWDIDKGYIDLDTQWVVDPPDETGRKCCVLGHHNPPKYHW